MKRYKRKFEIKEAEISPRPSKNEMDLMSIIFDVVKFYPKTVMTAYSLYERISKICGKNAIPLYRFQGDVDSKSALKMNTWIDTFYNSSLFSMLESKNETVENFARDILQNDKDDLKFKFMKAVYMKKPKSIEQLEKIVIGLSK